MHDPHARTPGARSQDRAARRRSLRRRRAGAAALLCLLVAALVVLLARGGGSHAGAHGPLSPAAGGEVSRAPAARAVTHRTAAEPARSLQLQRLIALGRPVFCAARRGDEVALTFDDGPGPYTRLVLAKLRKHHVHATFFVVGRNIPLVAGAVSVEARRGAVGDHTFTHPLLTSLPGAEAEDQIVRTQRALERASRDPVVLFRPPYGAHNATVDRIARAHGLLEILWNVDSADSLGAGYAQVERNVIAGLRPGAIILMHENHGQTVRALLGIFATLQRRHLRAVSVPQLLIDDPPSNAQVRAGGGGCGLSGGLHGD
jgi:peptidoglycan/xylan/chitin deacetylase (PgdA/CDA1 family)